MDDLRIDSHKLIFHPERVSQWLKDEVVCPIYVEIGPSGACNHRCIFCALDYLGYKNQFADTSLLKDAISDMGASGVKSIMYAGEGEPLLHKDIGELILYTRKTGIDVSVTTNGVLFSKDLAERCLGTLSWIRVSLDAGRKETYSRIHRCSEDDFSRVLENLIQAVKIRQNRQYGATIGVQFLLLPQNYEETVILASRLRDIGVDYLIIKPFSQHPMSGNTLDKNFHYKDYFYLNDELQKFSTDKFRVIFRIDTMRTIEDKKRVYEHCLGIPFWAYIDSSLNVWACSAYLGNANFLYGNLKENTFSEILQGERRRQIIKMAAEELDTSKCREACRLDKINRYLWELRHPHPHVNFI